MLTNIIAKIRGLTEDFERTTSDIRRYVSSKIFTLNQEHPNLLVTTYINNLPLESGQSATLDTSTNKVTVVANLVIDDVLEFKYTYYCKNSDELLKQYIISALVWISLYGDEDFELEDADGDSYVYPTPNNKEEDLIAVIASILINPNFETYKFGNVSMSYPKDTPKGEKIKGIIQDFYSCEGVWCTLELDKNYDRFTQ
ncbi:MAG: hypothetical protein ACTSPD_09730 [Promethearchaeota archaeon]